MLRNGYEVSFREKNCFITDSHDSAIAKIKMKGNSFYLNLDAIEGLALSAKTDESIIWHKSFGHHNFNSLMMLHDNVLVEGMPEIPASKQMSEGCEYEKQHQKPFPQFTSSRALSNLQLVHSDICEPMNIAFLKNFAYFMLFKD